MQSSFFTKNPLNMVFTDEGTSNRFLGRLSNHTLEQLLTNYSNKEGSKDDILLIKENKHELSERITNEQDDFINREGKFSAIDFNFYPIESTSPIFDDTVVSKADLMTDIAYSVSSLSTLFATAYDDISCNKYDNMPTPTQRQKVTDALFSAVDRGANVEILKLHLAKVLNEQYEDIKANGKNSKYAPSEVQRTLSLLQNAENLAKESPYENLFNMGKKLAELKTKANNASKNGNDNEAEKLQDQYSDLREALKSECAKFDPEMLKDVAAQRRQYLIEVDKNMAISKDQTFDSTFTRMTPDYRGALEVETIAKYAFEKQNAKTAQ